MSRAKWLDVDLDGLKQIIARQRAAFLLYELYSNVADEAATHCTITLAHAARGLYRLTVEDDNPEGFKRLSDAYTLFAASLKKSNPEQAGRFNLGEKLVLAMCKQARVTTTTGSVIFDPDAGRRKGRSRRERGSLFEGLVWVTQEQYEEACKDFKRILPRDGLTVTLNGEEIPHRTPVQIITATLPTEIEGPEGQLVPTTRKTTISVYEGGPSFLYELGVPVVEIEDRWSYNIGQKVPLTVDRQNVPPSYLAKVRAFVLNEMHETLTETDAERPWVTDALTRPETEPVVVKTVIERRFGENSVMFDPSDPEANKRASLEGFTVIPPRSLPTEAWDKAREIGAYKPAGQQFPTPRPYSPDGSPLATVPEEKVTDGMVLVERLAIDLGKRIFNRHIGVLFALDSQWPFSATFGSSYVLTLNVGRLGYDWFERRERLAVLSLIIHEFAHYRNSGHLLDEHGYDDLAEIGAKVTLIALQEPELFKVLK